MLTCSDQLLKYGAGLVEQQAFEDSNRSIVVIYYFIETALILKILEAIENVYHVL